MILPKNTLNEVGLNSDRGAHLNTECSDTSVERYQTSLAQRLDTKIQRFHFAASKAIGKHSIACSRLSKSKKLKKTMVRNLKNKLNSLKQLADMQDRLIDQYDKEKEILVKKLSVLESMKC